MVGGTPGRTYGTALLLPRSRVMRPPVRVAPESVSAVVAVLAAGVCSVACALTHMMVEVAAVTVRMRSQLPVEGQVH